jgi:hypothetical protein
MGKLEQPIGFTAHSRQHNNHLVPVFDSSLNAIRHAVDALD